MVDAGDNQVGHPTATKLVEGYLHTIYRCSRARPDLHVITHVVEVVATFQDEWIDRREGTGVARASAIGRTDQYVS